MTTKTSELNRHELFVHILPPEKKEPDLKPTPLIQKIIKVAAYALVMLSFVLIGLGVLNPQLITVGILSLISGCQLLYTVEKGAYPKLKSLTIGDFEVGY